MFNKYLCHSARICVRMSITAPPFHFQSHILLVILTNNLDLLHIAINIKEGPERKSTVYMHQDCSLPIISGVQDLTC